MLVTNELPRIVLTTPIRSSATTCYSTHALLSGRHMIDHVNLQLEQMLQLGNPAATRFFGPALLP